jgi:hypothetical protein
MSINNNYHFIPNVHVKKCGYLLTIINREEFIEIGADFIENSSIFYIKRDYDGSSTGETEALIGVNYKDVKSFVENEEKCNFLNLIKNCYELNYVEDIENIDMSEIQKGILKYFSGILGNMQEDELIILNIEPRGRTQKQLKIYPHPCLSIPGGNMEKDDNLSFEKCAVREFIEETGININEKYKIIGVKKHPILKTYYKDKNLGKVYAISYPNHKNNKSFHNKNRTVRIEMTYFLARLK